MYNNKKTINPPKITVAAVSKFSALNKYIRIVSFLSETEKAFCISCLIQWNDKIIRLERHQT